MGGQKRVGDWREVEARKNWMPETGGRPKRGGRPKKGGRLERSRGQKKLEAEMGWEAKKV